MAHTIQKQYNRKRPAHPDNAHTKSKRWFKQKGRRRVRKHLKEQLRDRRSGEFSLRHDHPGRMCPA